MEVSSAGTGARPFASTHPPAATGRAPALLLVARAGGVRSRRRFRAARRNLRSASRYAARWARYVLRRLQPSDSSAAWRQALRPRPKAAPQCQPRGRKGAAFARRFAVVAPMLLKPNYAALLSLVGFGTASSKKNAFGGAAGFGSGAAPVAALRQRNAPQLLPAFCCGRRKFPALARCCCCCNIRRRSRSQAAAAARQPLRASLRPRRRRRRAANVAEKKQKNFWKFLKKSGTSFVLKCLSNQLIRGIN